MIIYDSLSILRVAKAGLKRKKRKAYSFNPHIVTLITRNLPVQFTPVASDALKVEESNVS